MVHSNHLAALTARHRIPSLYAYREDVMAGGLMSYGANFLAAAQELGVYAGGVLKGEKPGNLAGAASNKIAFVINMQTGKALGIAVSPSLLARADEVIE